MSATFLCYGAKSPLLDALISDLSRIASTEFVSSIEYLHAQNAGNVIAVSDFHTDIPVPSNKRLFAIKLFGKGDIPVQKDYVYYVSTESDPLEASKQIVKRIVSFEARHSVIISPETSPHFLLPVIPVTRFNSFTPIVENVIEKPVVKVTVSPTPPIAHIPVIKKKMRRPQISSLKKVIPVFSIILIWIFSFPLVLLLLSGICSYGAFKTFTSPSSVITLPLLQCSKVSSAGAATLTQFFPTKSPQNLATFIHESSSVGIDIYHLYKKIASENSYKSLSTFSPELSHISRELLSLSSHTSEIAQVSAFSKQIPFILSHAKLFDVLALGAQESQSVLGTHTPQTYAVLLQNNMELRPTGGFIGSFILIEVDNGEVTSQKIYDVYDADGQISGYVEPPTPIVKYLGEASWHLRDSNWDPDFPTTAKRVSWFIDKSLDRRVDGVIAVDLEVLRSIIGIIGPLKVGDYGGELTKENFYKTIQSEVHKEFFPGSHKKSNYLTAVFNAALSRLSEEGYTKSLPLLTSFLTNLDARDIQMYSTNEELQTSFIKAGIAGQMPLDGIAFNEANLGVNKANQYISRRGTFSFEKGESITSVKHVLEIKNNAKEKTDETRYRVYLRSFAPKGSNLVKFKVRVQGQEQALVPEQTQNQTREEAGVFFEVGGGEAAVISAEWLVPTSPELVLVKQSGVDSYPLSGTVLTGEVNKQYNTTFGKDLPIQF